MIHQLLTNQYLMYRKRKRNIQKVNYGQKLVSQNLVQILPLEIWEHILSYCRFWDYMAFRKTCKRATLFPIPKLPYCYTSFCTSQHSDRLNDGVVAGLTSLYSLTLPSNLLKCPDPLARLTKLKILFSPQNNFINLASLTRLKALELCYSCNPLQGAEKLTQLTKLNNHGYSMCFEENLINTFTNLLWLNLVNNHTITNLNALQRLTYLIAPKRMRCNEIKKLTNLMKLDLEGNFFVDEISSLTKLTYLKTNDLLRDGSFVFLTKLNVLKIICPFSDLNLLINLTKLKFTNHRGFPLGRNCISSLTNLKTLCLSRYWQPIKISHLTNLTKLNISRSLILNDDLLHLTNLRSLNMAGNEFITSVRHLSNLTYLKANSKIKQEQLKNLTNLRKLSCSYSFFCGKFLLTNLTNLVHLTCRSDKMGNIHNFTNLTSLKVNLMTIHDSFIGDISKLTRLKRLKGGFYSDTNLLLRIPNLEVINKNLLTDNRKHKLKGKKHLLLS